MCPNSTVPTLTPHPRPAAEETSAETVLDTCFLEVAGHCPHYAPLYPTVPWGHRLPHPEPPHLSLPSRNHPTPGHAPGVSKAFSRCSNHWLVGTSAVLSLGLHSKSSPNIGCSQDQMTLGSLASPDPHKENPVWMAMPGTAMCWSPTAGSEGAIKAGLELAAPRGLEHLGTPIPSLRAHLPSPL